MNKDQIRNRIEEIGIIPAIRLSSAEDALFAAEAVSSSGIPIVEVTMTVPGAIELISELARSNPELVVGAGSVFDLKTASRCLDAGSGFLTSPRSGPVNR
jgi:2-dehydro-3-deoxyphosphogluconate aldolase/(4S)-4-hydroxy-2-oxoglutarate aldolase